MKPPKDLKPGPETAAYVKDIIESYPDLHYQGSWESYGHLCGTTRCVGGWTIWAHRLNVDYEKREEATSNSRLAGRLLGIDDRESDMLFYWTQDQEHVLRALEFLARGEAIDWTIVFKDHPYLEALRDEPDYPLRDV